MVLAWLNHDGPFLAAALPTDRYGLAQLVHEQRDVLAACLLLSLGLYRRLWRWWLAAAESYLRRKKGGCNRAGYLPELRSDYLSTGLAPRTEAAGYLDTAGANS